MVYTWGQGDEGELGNGAKADQYFAAPITASVDGNIDALYTSSSAHHAFIHTDADKVYGWGTNEYGPLGISGIDITTPTLIPSLSDILVHQISTGYLSGGLFWNASPSQTADVGHGYEMFILDENERLLQKIDHTIGISGSSYGPPINTSIPSGAVKLGVAYALGIGTISPIATVGIVDKGAGETIHMAQNLHFIDTDPGMGELRGTLKWEAAMDESTISTYAIYLLGVDNTKLVKLGEVAKGSAYEWNLPVDTAKSSATKLAVVTTDADPISSIPLIDTTVTNNDDYIGWLYGQLDTDYNDVDVADIIRYAAAQPDVDGDQNYDATDLLYLFPLIEHLVIPGE